MADSAQIEIFGAPRPGAYAETWADIDTTGCYRYLLGRIWDRKLPRVLYVMINPSTADGNKDDPTIKRCVGFARSWGFGSIEVVNLFAWRSAHWRDLLSVADPVGPENDEKITGAVARAHLVVAAWGPKPIVKLRQDAVVRIVHAAHEVFHAIRVVDDVPHHPLMLPGNLSPSLWRRRSST